MRILTNVNVDWLRWRWHALVLSWLLIIAGVGVIVTRGLPLGIDFSGGTLVVVRFEQPVSDDAIRDAIPGNEEIVQRYGDAPNEVQIRLPLIEGAARRRSSSRPAQLLVDQLQAANLGTFDVLSTDFVGPVIGRDLQWRGVSTRPWPRWSASPPTSPCASASVSASARWWPACTTC